MSCMHGDLWVIQHNNARKGLVLPKVSKSHSYRTLYTTATLAIILGLVTTLNIWPHAQMRCNLLAKRTVSLHDNSKKRTSCEQTMPSSSYTSKLTCLKSRSHYLTWDQYDIQTLRISWVTRGSDKASTHRRVNLSCLHRNREPDIRHHQTYFALIISVVYNRNLSGAQDRNLSPACLKLFSFSIAICIKK